MGLVESEQHINLPHLSPGLGKMLPLRKIILLLFLNLPRFLLLKEKVKPYTKNKSQAILPYKNRSSLAQITSIDDPVGKILSNVTLDGGLQLISITNGKVIWTNNLAIPQPLLSINSMLSSTSKSTSRQLISKEQANDEEVLGYTFFYIFQPIGKGQIFVAKEGVLFFFHSTFSTRSKKFF